MSMTLEQIRDDIRKLAFDRPELEVDLWADEIDAILTTPPKVAVSDELVGGLRKWFAEHTGVRIHPGELRTALESLSARLAQPVVAGSAHANECGKSMATVVCDAIIKHQYSDDHRRGRLSVDVETLLKAINEARDSGVTRTCEGLSSQRQPQGAQGEAVAWMDPDGIRVITAKAKENASSAYKTATAGYTVPLYTHPHIESNRPIQWPRLESQARIGATTFGKGVSTKIVVQRAIREHEWHIANPFPNLVHGDHPANENEGWREMDSAPADKAIMGAWFGSPEYTEISPVIYCSERGKWMNPDDMRDDEYTKPDMWHPYPSAPPHRAIDQAIAAKRGDGNG